MDDKPNLEFFHLADLPFDPPTEGLVVRAPINSQAHTERLPDFSLPESRFGVSTYDNGESFLWYQIAASDLVLGDPSDWARIWVKMNYLLESMAIFTAGNYWIGDRLHTERGLAWERPQAVALVPDKEYAADPDSLPSLGDVEVGVVGVNLQYHLATTFPRAWEYHNVGCALLRMSFPGREFYTDALLNFFKIGEMITAHIYSVNPELKHIQQATQSLTGDMWTDDDIKGFYVVRSRDAAHDWLTAVPVTRESAVDCKLWAEAMIVNHWAEHGEVVLSVTRNGQRFPAHKGDPG